MQRVRSFEAVRDQAIGLRYVALGPELVGAAFLVFVEELARAFEFGGLQQRINSFEKQTTLLETRGFRPARPVTTILGGGERHLRANGRDG